MLPIFFGFLSALSWGAGDFSGGLASRKLGAYRAVLYADFFGLLLIGVVMSVFHELIPSAYVLINSAVGGRVGLRGVVDFVLQPHQRTNEHRSAGFRFIRGGAPGHRRSDHGGSPEAASTPWIWDRPHGGLADLTRQPDGALPPGTSGRLAPAHSGGRWIWLLLHLHSQRDAANGRGPLDDAHLPPRRDTVIALCRAHTA